MPNFEFRAEAFNTFNHTQFNAFNNNLNYKLVAGVYTPHPTLDRDRHAGPERVRVRR